MSSSEQIRESIETRLGELRKEIASLQDARDALHPSSASGALSGSGQGGSGAAKPRRRSSRSGDRESAGTAGAATTAPSAPAPAVSAPSTKPDVPPPPPRKPTNRRPARNKRPGEVLFSGKLEEMLRDAPDGLNAVAIATAANARERQVRDLLRELERTGQVRRTGAGRGSRWRLITDEERIAGRAAELAARTTKP